MYNHFLECSFVSTDSRKIVKDCLFFALHGANFDGNNYAISALKGGAKYAVIDNPTIKEQNREYDSRLILVENTLSALKDLARYHRQQLGCKIIGIVGSNGKTTTKELTAAVLSTTYHTAYTQGNLNNEIGVPLTLLTLKSSDQMAVVEMGASAQKEIQMLCNISLPDYGVITNIGTSHLGGFGGVEGIRKGKGELYDFLNENGGVAFVPTEDTTLCQMASERDKMTICYYSRAIADNFETQLVGDFNRYNMAVAIAIGRYFKVSEENIAKAIAQYSPTNNRSQLIRTHSNEIIADCYNANPTSMTLSINNIATINTKKKMLILGDMLELGQWSAEQHEAVLKTALAIENAKIILVGEEFAKAYAQLKYEDCNAKCINFNTTEEVAEYIQNSDVEGYTILLKGSRKIGLEKLIQIIK